MTKKKALIITVDAGLVIIESVKFNQHTVTDSFLDWLNNVSSSSHGVFYLDLLVERKFKKFDKWIDKEGRFIHEFPVGILLAGKPLTVQLHDLCSINM